jgi:transcriptional regulator with XRE-family HTH domain
MNQLGKFIEHKRRELGLSLRAFAEMCGISHSYLDSLEKGMDARSGKPVSPTIETLQKLASGLKMSLIDILCIGGFVDPAINQDNSIMIDDELVTFVREISPKLSPEERTDLKELIRLFVKKTEKSK